jgi:hypothetical protein
MDRLRLLLLVRRRWIKPRWKGDKAFAVQG